MKEIVSRIYAAWGIFFTIFIKGFTSLESPLHTIGDAIFWTYAILKLFNRFRKK